MTSAGDDFSFPLLKAIVHYRDEVWQIEYITLFFLRSPLLLILQASVLIVERNAKHVLYLA
jgi:hypothetical protein